MIVRGEISNDTAVVNRVDNMRSGLRPRVRAVVQKLVLMLQRRVVKDKLSGQVLNVRTGRLRRSIDQAVIEGSTNVTGVVSTNLVYARAHEYGVHKTVSVKEHLRMQVKAWGKPMNPPRKVSVQAHPMKMNLPEASFLRSALREMNQAGIISREISKGIGEAVK